MKTCPTCQRTYGDETLNFCLDDGDVLSAPYDPSQTLVMPETRTTDPTGHRPPPPQSTILAVQPPNFQSNKVPPQREEGRSAVRWLVIGLALTFGILIGAGVLGAFVWSQSGPVANSNSNIARSSPTPMASPSASPKGTIEEDTDGWEEHEDTQIKVGERIRYYPVTTALQCETDCAANQNCKAYTVIKAGTYSPTDPPMCYLMSEVTTLDPSTCCFTAIKR
ncbi:MAG: hypothetical protein DMF69_00210 [Acidobacteria bacterium]|nr:MAG: hypothetical protein DMF69_00210 [Acidobacteriota bacterium]